MIKNLHQIWVGPNKLPDKIRVYTEEMRNMNPDFTYYWWDDAAVNAYLDSMPPNFQYQYMEFYSSKQYAFCADILRLWIIYAFGGFYLDVDFKPLLSLNTFAEHGLLLYHPNSFPEADLTIVNGAFGLEAKSPILAYVIDKIGPSGYWYGPEWLGRTIKEYLGYPYDIPHMIVKDKLHSMGIWYFDWQLFDKQYNKHDALYSWNTSYIPEV